MLWKTINTLYDRAAGFVTVGLPFLGFGLVRRWFGLLAAAGWPAASAAWPNASRSRWCCCVPDEARPSMTARGCG